MTATTTRLSYLLLDTLLQPMIMVTLVHQASVRAYRAPDDRTTTHLDDYCTYVRTCDILYLPRMRKPFSDFNRRRNRKKIDKLLFLNYFAARYFKLLYINQTDNVRTYKNTFGQTDWAGERLQDIDIQRKINEQECVTTEKRKIVYESTPCKTANIFSVLKLTN